MTLKEARQLRDRIREAGVHCIVPLGYGPDRYFARIFRSESSELKPVDFHDWKSWMKYAEQRVYEATNRLRGQLGMSRSPIERMIDQACGLE